MSSIADGQLPVVPPTIADASVVDTLRSVLRPEPTVATFRPHRAAAR